MKILHLSNIDEIQTLMILLWSDAANDAAQGGIDDSFRTFQTMKRRKPSNQIV